MQHFLDGAGIVPALNNVKGYAFTDLEEGSVWLFQGKWLALSDRVDGLAILKLFGGFFLHFEISFVGSERVSIYRLIPFLRPFFLCKSIGTRLMGLRYFLTC